MSELSPPPTPASDYVAAQEDALAAWNTRRSEPVRGERAVHRAAPLRKVRTFIKANGSLAAMFTVVFVNLVGFGIVVPLIPFFAQSLNAQAWQVTWMFTFFSLGQFFAEPLCGALSDRVGRKPILIATTALSTLFYAGLAFAPNIWIAILFRFFGGLAAGNISTIQGYVCDMSAPEKRSGRMSLIGGAFSLGFIMGPFFGGVLTHGHSGADLFRLPLLVAAAMSAVTAIGIALFIRESRTPMARTVTARLSLLDRAEAGLMNLSRTAKTAFATPAIVRVIAATLCYMAALAGLEATFGLWAEARYHWDAVRIGNVFPFLGAAAAVMQFIFMRPLIRRFGEERVLAWGLFVFGLSFAGQALNANPGFVTPVVMFGAAGQAVVFSSICAIIAAWTPSDRQGAMLGFNMSVGAIARIFGPAIAGFLFSRWGADAPIWMGVAMTVPAALLALQARRWRKKAPSRP
jgi:MFS family permease